MTASRINVCGVVVHLAPDGREAARAAIAQIDGVDVHGLSDDGRMVVTAIDTGGAMAIDQISAISRLPGVLSTALAYHAFEDIIDDSDGDMRRAARDATHSDAGGQVS